MQAGAGLLSPGLNKTSVSLCLPNSAFQTCNSYKCHTCDVFLCIIMVVYLTLHPTAAKPSQNMPILILVFGTCSSFVWDVLYTASIRFAMQAQQKIPCKSWQLWQVCRLTCLCIFTSWQ